MLGAATAGSAGDHAAHGAELHGARRRSAQVGAGVAASSLTLVTLDCRPFDIMKSVAEAVAAVYSPTVLRLRGQP
jgi:hypothetical protein